MKNIDSIKVRMYRHGFGDCFLLRFFVGAQRKCSLLIDCGLKLNDKVEGVSLINVRDDISKALLGKSRKTAPHLDILAVTHEHWDHVSGFHPREKLFDNFGIGELWMAWTEDPDDVDAKILNNGLLKRVKALKIAADRLKECNTSKAEFYKQQVGGEGIMAARRAYTESLEAVMGFLGPVALTKTTAGGIKVKEKYKISQDTQDAMDNIRVLANKAGAGIRYMSPGKVVIDQQKLPGIRIYVLGPPKNKLLNKAAPSSGVKKEVYFGDSSLAGFVEGVIAGKERETGNPGDTSADNGRPFGTVTCMTAIEAQAQQYLKNSYFHAWEAYRTIDDDWLDMAGALAMQMDTDTNNTSLALAIEFIESGKVLLFPGDAQVGNWLSWHELEWEIEHNGNKEKLNAASLLERTVCYKAGHHSSHNATLKAKGLELMTSPDLVALVPEKEKQYNGIPFKPLLTKLKQKTKGRLVVSADKNYPAENVLIKKPDALSTKEWTVFKENIDITKLFVELTVRT
ncbi:hypothetical protein [[Flexibacter] sp. ATCC 35208]|uniref:hypothetical protein n=1 Tax=[Flexibacter] sp. ATCC 35208 TaxID=1936242 RepID=UPI0009D2B900|nr:hypothetical protein [[Flexibacter] sp. ATCC 35208]OMP75677.1 hypothetical protein BW716_28805 [[Flexibacter] sp. ATCC 35208]